MNNPIKIIDARISRKLAGIRQAFRGVLTLVKAAGAVQLVQLDGVSGERLQDAELFQHYGCTSNPPKGSMAIVLPIGGKTSHGIVIATEHGTYRLKNLASGEVALYDDQGQKIHITRNGIVVDGGGKPINIQNTPHVTATTAKFTISGDLEVGGKADVTGNITSVVNIVAGGNVTAAGNVLGAILASAGAITAMNGAISMSDMKSAYNSHIHTAPNGPTSTTSAPM